jgi:hypothetical protein
MLAPASGRAGETGAAVALAGCTALPIQPARGTLQGETALLSPGEAWGRRLDAERLRRLRPGAFDFETLNHIAVDDEHLARVMDALGFARIECEIAMRDQSDGLHPRLRSAAEWWPDPDGPLVIFSGETVGHVAVDIGSGAWRTMPLHGPRGLDLVALVEHRLALPRWKAAVALARMCCLPHVPQIAREARQ